jgi:hypothetical protein
MKLPQEEEEEEEEEPSVMPEMFLWWTSHDPRT